MSTTKYTNLAKAVRAFNGNTLRGRWSLVVGPLADVVRKDKRPDSELADAIYAGAKLAKLTDSELADAGLSTESLRKLVPLVRRVDAATLATMAETATLSPTSVAVTYNAAVMVSEGKAKVGGGKFTDTDITQVHKALASEIAKPAAKREGSKPFMVKRALSKPVQVAAPAPAAKPDAPADDPIGSAGMTGDGDKDRPDTLDLSEALKSDHDATINRIIAAINIMSRADAERIGKAVGARINALDERAIVSAGKAEVLAALTA